MKRLTNKEVFIFFVFLFVFLNISYVKAECSSVNNSLFRISATSNAHAELWNGTGNYRVDLCFEDYFRGAIPGTNWRNCSNNTVIRLSAATNAHVEAPNRTNYSVQVCFADLKCALQAGPNAEPCKNFDVDLVTSGVQQGSFIASLSAPTNAHIALGRVYDYYLCCKSNAYTVCNYDDVCDSPEENWINCPADCCSLTSPSASCKASCNADEVATSGYCSQGEVCCRPQADNEDQICDSVGGTCRSGNCNSGEYADNSKVCSVQGDVCCRAGNPTCQNSSWCKTEASCISEGGIVGDGTCRAGGNVCCIPSNQICMHTCEQSCSDGRVEVSPRKYCENPGKKCCRSTGPPPNECGNGVCSSNENVSSCPRDCCSASALGYTPTRCIDFTSSQACSVCSSYYGPSWFNVGDISSFTGNLPIVDARCSWNSQTNKCLFNYTVIGGGVTGGGGGNTISDCVVEHLSVPECGQGDDFRVVTLRIRNLSGPIENCGDLGCGANGRECEIQYPCPRVVKMPFFSWINAIFAMIIIGAIYFFAYRSIIKKRIIKINSQKLKK